MAAANAHNDKNRNLQQKQLKVQVGLLIVTTLAFFGAAIYAWIAYRQWETAEKTMIGTQRPWISVHVNLENGVKYDQKGVSIPVAYKIKNIGNSPAIGIWIDAEPVLGFGNMEEVIDEHRRILTNLRRTHQLGAPGFGHMLFPGEDFTKEVTFQITAEDIEKYQTKMAKLRKQDLGDRPAANHDLGASYPIFPNIVGCVFYGFSFDESIHKTGFIAQLYRADPLHPNSRFGIEYTNSKGASALVLEPLIVGSYAD
jgi:hypothetical protein